MNRYIGYLLMSIICFGCQSTPQNEGLVLKEVIDLGAVTVGQTVDFTIDILNPTDQFIKIITVKGNCGCLTVNNCPSGIKPKQNGTINATYSSEFDKKLSGILYKNVVIQLDKKPFIRSVKLKVNVK